MLERAQVLTEQGDWELAATTFERVVGARDPSLHVAALLGLAEARYRMDDEPAALQAWITATQAPETGLTWRAWQQLAAARVRTGDLAGAARAYREAERRAPDEARGEIASRLGWLSKELGDSGAAQRAFARSRGGAPSPVATWSILSVTVAIGISMFLFDQRAMWWDLFALDKRAVTEGEYWRLLSPVLVHGSIIHLAFNMYALWIIGPIVEALYGWQRFLLVYLACAGAGSAASYVLSPAPLSVGASGAVFGLFGMLLLADRVHKPALTRNARSLTMQIGVLIGINLLIGFTLPSIDNAAHIGGLVAGAWLGLVMVPKGALTLASFWRRPGPGGAQAQGPSVLGGREHVATLLGFLALVAVIVLAVAVGPLRLLP
jgi:membrane associated rhomboid family serine protease